MNKWPLWTVNGCSLKVVARISVVFFGDSTVFCNCWTVLKNQSGLFIKPHEQAHLARCLPVSSSVAWNMLPRGSHWGCGTERLKPSMCRDTYANYFPVKYSPSPSPPFKFMLAAGGGVIVAYINVPHLFIAAIINDRNTVNTYTVGTYSPGKLSVVYEMSIHVLPTVPSPTTTHLIGRPGWAMIGQILQQITTCCLFERSISVSDSTQYTYPS